VVFFKISPGENEAAVLDYMKHYRSRSVGLIDFDYQVMDAYHAGSWPNTLIIDPEGKVRYHNVMASRHKEEIHRLLDELTRDLKVVRLEGIEEAYCKEGICYIPQRTGITPPGRRDFLPRAAVDSQNRLWVVFTSNRDGDNNIYLRHYEEGKPSKDISVTQSISDDYAPDIAVGPDGTLWIAWVSDRTGKYDIFLKSYQEGQWSEAMAVTHSDDDAFHPRLAVDDKGGVWITYYKWNRQFGASRDRDVFARFYKDQSWSEEIEVNPPEPKVEDHTDPDVVIDPKGQVWIAWSYDYHPQLFDKPLDTDQPSIFVQRLVNGQKEGEPLLVGTRGRNLHAIDLFPALAISPDGTVWCAWDASFEDKRVILVSQFQGGSSPAGSGFGPEIRVSAADEIVSTPSICVDREGNPHVVWSQQAEGRWRFFGSHYQKGSWTEPTPWVEGEGDCRNPTLLVDKQNQLWVVYEHQVGKDTKVMVAKIP